MTRKEAIDILKNTIVRFGRTNGKTAYAEALQMAIKALEEQRWIPCSERPPEEGHDVLITKESFKIKGYEQEIVKAKRSVDPRSGEIEWWSPEFGTLTNKAVLAWMPLPEPYREEGEEDDDRKL